MPEPAPAPEPMGGLNMPTPAPKGGGEEMQMEMADMEMEEMEMATSLFVFDPAVPLVLVLDVWRVESWAAYLATLLALVVWSIAHEQLAPLRAAVVATVAKPTRRESGPLGDSLTAGGAAEIVTATSNPVGASVVALLEITIGGMTCDGCSARIQGVVSAMDGVISADVQFGTGSATVVRDPQTATEASLLERVRDLGYEAATAAPSHAATADAVCYAPCGSSGKADPLNADGGSSAAAAWRQENGGMPDPYERLVQVVLLLGDDNGELVSTQAIPTTTRVIPMDISDRRSVHFSC